MLKVKVDSTFDHVLSFMDSGYVFKVSNIPTCKLYNDLFNAFNRREEVSVTFPNGVSFTGLVKYITPKSHSESEVGMTALRKN